MLRSQSALMEELFTVKRVYYLQIVPRVELVSSDCYFPRTSIVMVIDCRVDVFCRASTTYHLHSAHTKVQTTEQQYATTFYHSNHFRKISSVTTMSGSTKSASEKTVIEKSQKEVMKDVPDKM